MNGIRPRVCPKCGCRKLNKRETFGSATKGLISATYDLIAGVSTLGIWWLAGNKPRTKRTMIYTCKNKKCRFEWEVDID
jgi:hypothetical protein